MHAGSVICWVFYSNIGRTTQSREEEEWVRQRLNSLRPIFMPHWLTNDNGRLRRVSSRCKLTTAREGCVICWVFYSNIGPGN